MHKSVILLFIYLILSISQTYFSCIENLEHLLVLHDSNYSMPAEETEDIGTSFQYGEPSAKVDENANEVVKQLESPFPKEKEPNESGDFSNDDDLNGLAASFFASSATTTKAATWMVVVCAAVGTILHFIKSGQTVSCGA